ncbi:hypothetical protein LCGC14_0442880 [marine sediment metagenome]|uniref:Uncharacterized protein n=1 Tax=marine sediment metagenome TaxID=412755 RepID=A0A0F9VU96_9ZZZZ
MKEAARENWRNHFRKLQEDNRLKERLNRHEAELLDCQTRIDHITEIIQLGHEILDE